MGNNDMTPSTDDGASRSAAAPAVVRMMRGLEESPALDGLGDAVELLSRPLSGERVSAVLRGQWAGHALHPALTDLPIGFWTSALLLDLCGGRPSRRAAEVLVAAGLVSAVPAVATGLVEWRATSPSEGRVGSLHAALNGCATLLYGVSLAMRRRGCHGAGMAAGLAGAAAAGGAGYLGGHLAVARKVGSRAAGFAPVGN